MVRRRKRVQRDWPAIIAAQAASGLSGLAYCREQGISPSLFYRRRQRHGVPPSRAAGFVELLAVDGTPAVSGVSLVSARGWRIELSPQFDAPTLQRALACLQPDGACWR